MGLFSHESLPFNTHQFISFTILSLPQGLKPGASHVFEDVEDTGMEELIESSRTLSERRAVEEVGRNLERMTRLALNCGSFLRTKSLDDVDTRKTAAKIFAEKMASLEFDGFLAMLNHGFEETIEKNLKPSVEVGVNDAEGVCQQKAKGWGEGKPSRGNEKTGPITGLKWNQVRSFMFVRHVLIFNLVLNLNLFF